MKYSRGMNPNSRNGFTKGHFPYRAMLGKKHTAESRLKMSLKLKGLKRTEETKMKNSLANIGKKLSEETKRKISLAGKGKIFSKERRENISKSLKGKTWDILGRKKQDPSITYEKKLVLNANRRELNKNAEGSHTYEEWINLCKTYKYMCLCCKRTDVKLTEDHIIPLSKGGTNYIWNIQPLCLSCNIRKYDKTINFKKRLEEIVL